MRMAMQTTGEPRTRRSGPRMGQGRWIFFGLALGALLGLCATPKVGWIARQQVKQALQAPLRTKIIMIDAGDTGRMAELLQARMHAAAALAPGDVGVQIAAAAFFNSPPADGVEKKDLPDAVYQQLAHIAQNNPNSPLAQAVLLRGMTQAKIDLKRDEEITAHGLQPKSPRPAPLPDGIAVGQFLAAAERGERADPDNAYFPTLAAIGQAVLHHDRQAFLALDRAVQKPRWEDYTPQEMEGQSRLTALEFGPQTSLVRCLLQASHLYPELSQFRALARFTLNQAIRQERAGDVGGGVALRARLLRVSALMRDQSHSLIGALVGDAVFSLALGNPGGAIPGIKYSTPDRRNETQTQRISHNTQIYTNYLRAHQAGGNTAVPNLALSSNNASRSFLQHGDAEAAWVESQQADVMRTMGWNYDTTPTFLRLGILTIASLSLLSQAVVFLAIGGVCAVWSYRQRFADPTPRPQTQAAKTGIGLGVAAFGLLYGAWAGFAAGEWLITLGTLVVFCGVIGWFVSGILRQELRTLLRPALMTLAFLLGLSSLTAWQTGRISASVAFLREFSGAQANAQLGTLLFALVALLPLVVFAVLFAIGSRARRVPVATGVARAFHASALPFAALLLLCYLGVSVTLARLDYSANQTMNGQMTNELVWAERHGERRPDALLSN